MTDQVVNRALLSLHRGSLEIKLIYKVSLNSPDKIRFATTDQYKTDKSHLMNDDPDFHEKFQFSRLESVITPWPLIVHH